MGLHEILCYLYNSRSISDSAKRITGGSLLYEDLLSELYLVISEKDLAFVTGLIERKELEAYCHVIMYYMYVHPRSEFRKKYFTGSVDLVWDIVEETTEEYDIEIVKKVLSKLERKIAQKRYPTEIRLLELYADKGNFRAVGTEVGISFKTAQYLVKQITETIRKEYDISSNI